MSRESLNAWQNDWKEFAKVLQAKLSSCESKADLSAYFGGVEICWTGTIERFDFDATARLVMVSLPPQSIIVGNDRVVLLDNLALAVSSDCQEKWNELKVGDKVTFVATLHNKDATFPPIEVTTLSTGKTIIFVNANKSRPVHC